MCEVGSCCGCISLYRGCLVSGVITVMASIAQCLVFSFILHESYDSRATASTVNATNELEEFYSFSGSSLCPFGFIPYTVNETQYNITNFNGSRNDSLFNSTLEKQETPQNITNTTNPVLLSCLAPQQGVLWAIVIASAFYAPVGVVLIVGVKKGISYLLSTWFFYTVGYNLLCLIVALTDGVYIGAGDVSSYIVCLVTAYCIIVVDSYYEKLLRHERAVTSATAHGRPSLVVVKSTPVSPTSPESSPIYNPTLGKFMSVPSGYAPPGSEASDLLLPSRASPSRELPQA